MVDGRNLVAAGILLDAVAQFLIYRQVHPGAALVVGIITLATAFGSGSSWSPGDIPGIDEPSITLPSSPGVGAGTNKPPRSSEAGVMVGVYN